METILVVAGIFFVIWFAVDYILRKRRLKRKMEEITKRAEARALKRAQQKGF